ncbi:uncharacterized protein B0I36DRAFT_342544 [Microdochium trichocladiopsis]|uniref:Uncharacterized protein n=1 Tax=Microdochium trichocladiopsis TaxID=1682393 RepID=A0A9P8XS90_9PEZI|nr:uncharacterized protein B0I36DRAFT_342544 [Microdochium trichocladiopsis]KAH7009203.1 hypothetical protein B0I36DRAFT_342544 [Microdochium trichocladiopsis]
MASYPDHPIFKSNVFHTEEFLNFAASVREIHETASNDPYYEIVEQAIPAVAEKLRLVATQQADILRSNQRLERKVTSLEREVHSLRQLSWRVTMDIRPDGQELVQVHQLAHQGSPHAASPAPAVAPAVVPEVLNRAPLTPPVAVAAARGERAP